MIFLKKLYWFLGSVYLAIALIASLAIFVTIGTFLESKSGSHLYASHYTYGSPVFAGLLWLFFINILVSALRRWPFRMRHVPFLITHLGLLMIIGGTIIKNAIGVQGSMGIIEGSSAQEIFLANTQVIRLENREMLIADYPIAQRTPFTHLKSSSQLNNDVKIRLLQYFPHSKEKFESWIKKDVAVISGLPVVPVTHLKHQLMGAAKKVRMVNHHLEPWYLLVFRTTDPADISQEVYVEGMKLIFKNAATSELMQEKPLKEALATSLSFQGITAKTSLQWNFSTESGFQEPYVAIDFSFPNGNQETMHIPLTGDNSLQNLNVTSSHLGSLPVQVNLSRFPTLLFAINESDDVYYFVFDPFGRVYNQIYRQNHISELSVYDQGFGGYYQQAKVPFPDFPTDLDTMEQTSLWALSKELRKGIAANTELAPPLKLFATACQASNEDFCTCCLEFLRLCDKSHCWVLPHDILLPEKLQKVIGNLDWSKVPNNHQNGVLWIAQLFNQMGPHTEQFLHQIKQQGWPLPIDINSANLADILHTMTIQLFSLGDQMFALNTSQRDNAQMLSAYLRAYSLHLQQILPEKQPSWDSVHEYLTSTGQDYPPYAETILESPLSTVHQPELPLQKWEDNQPLAYLEVSAHDKTEKIALAYDRHGTGFKWPILDGSFLIRFQPQFRTIPYRIRLRDARQINYTNSTQPYSFESDILIYNAQGDVVDEATISMNHVYETWDGYRFYLASMSPSQETDAQRVQIVVNYDPAKYWLTYPGGIIVTLGIILLFWMRPYKKK